MKEDRDLYHTFKVTDKVTGEEKWVSQKIHTNKEGRKQLLEAMRKALLNSTPMSENEQGVANEALKLSSSKTPTINGMF